MKALANLANVSRKTSVNAVTSRACKTITKIVMETQDLVNHYIVLSVLHDRELKKFSPALILKKIT